MSKTVLMTGWVNIIPDELYDSFISRGFIKKGQYKLIEQNLQDTWFKVLRKKFQHGYVIVKKEHYMQMHEAIGLWYLEVFTYVTKWLKENKFINLKQGSFSGGFCAEEDANTETAKKWGAPVAKKTNKVAQIKEKFGEIRVYFNFLNNKERAKVKKFAKFVEKKFDCITVFC